MSETTSDPTCCSVCWRKFHTYYWVYVDGVPNGPFCGGCYAEAFPTPTPTREEE